VLFRSFKKRIYHPQISEDSIGVVVEMGKNLAQEIEEIFNNNQAHQILREPVDPKRDSGMLHFWGGVAVFLIIAIGVGSLFTFDILRIPFPSNMIDQESIAPQEGPRLAAPASSVPVLGSILVNGQPSTNLIPVSDSSHQRGRFFYSIECELCHGSKGLGDGPQSEFFKKKPADLTSSQIQNLEDEDIFMVIMQGFGIMPSLAENMNPQDGWDIVNFVRTLKK
jgi:mono/diheme cytochrome c family protein